MQNKFGCQIFINYKIRPIVYMKTIRYIGRIWLALTYLRIIDSETSLRYAL